jgi:hypothetical protein
MVQPRDDGAVAKQEQPNSTKLGIEWLTSLNKKVVLRSNW